MLTVQKPEWRGLPIAGVPDFDALPSFGRHDDLWLIAAGGPNSWRLMNDPNTRDEGILMPVFSPDRAQIAWSSRQPGGGTYKLKIGQFVAAPQPLLINIHSFERGGNCYCESASFSSSSKTLFHTSDRDTGSFWQSQIYSLDPTARLTVGTFHDEHPPFVKTPAGEWIVYMCTKGADRFPFRLMLGTDWYAMHADAAPPSA